MYKKQTSYPKLAYVAFCDVKGGAARGAHRLVQGFWNAGISCDFIVRRKFSDTSGAIEYDLPLSRRQKCFNDWLAKEIYPQLRTQSRVYQSFNLRHTGLDRYLNEQQYDLVIFHWVGGDTISIKEIGRLNMPIIWRLADEWVFSGSKHYLENESQDRTSSSLLDDADSFVFNRKVRFWQHLNAHFVTGSRWLCEQVRTSKLFSGYPARTIPSSLQTDIFKPGDTHEIASLLGLDPNKKYIVFGAANATQDHRKGFDLLIDALNSDCFTNANSVELLVFGNNDVPEVKASVPIRYMGSIQDDALLSSIYSIGTISAVPSRIDNLPFAAMESLSCGTPVVGFHIGGLPDIVDTKSLGELATAFDTDAFAQLLSRWTSIGKTRDIIDACRSKALNEYSVKTQVNRYRDLMVSVLEKNNDSQA